MTSYIFKAMNVKPATYLQILLTTEAALSESDSLISQDKQHTLDTALNRIAQE